MFQTLEPIPSEQLVNGTNCIIKTDEKWQRCIITNIDATTGLYIEYPDIGGGEEVTLDQVRILTLKKNLYLL